MKTRMRWRWDQGRLVYFRFDNIVRIARVLTGLDGVPLNTREDLLRQPLEQGTGLPFAPSHYKVWRNYARVFACSMLATQVDQKLVVTDLCRKLAEEPTALTADQYLNFVFSRFTLPYPAFNDFNPNVGVTFPFVAIAKFVFVRAGAGASLADVFSYVVGNGCTGLEELSFYLALKPTNCTPTGDEERQVREMLVFMGQVSYFKWFNRKLYADVSDVRPILQVITPKPKTSRKATGIEEFLALTSTGSDVDRMRLDVILSERETPQLAFVEGRRVFGTHGKLERSPMIRKMFFKLHPDLVCDACGINTKAMYPWTDNILELHHVLPLSATINVNGTTTSLDDMVPLCPSCHKGIHVYYRIKLDEWGVEDFGSKKMAKDVYQMAKGEIGSGAR